MGVPSKLLLSKGLERFAFYGYRAILTLFMIREIAPKTPGFDEDTAYELYASHGTWLYILPLFGGLLGDFLKAPLRVAQWGLVAAALGGLTLMHSSELALYSGLILLTLGVALYLPNLMSSLGGCYRSADRSLDEGWTSYYLITNLGALCGPLIIGFLGEGQYRTGFGLASISFLLALLPLCFTKFPAYTEEAADREEREKKTPIGVLLAISSFLLLMIGGWIFWSGREHLTSKLTLNEALRSRLEEELGFEGAFSILMQSSGVFLVLLFGLVALILWRYWRPPTFAKIGGAFFIFAALSFSVPTLFEGLLDPDGSSVSKVLLFLTGISIVEVLFAPLVYAQLTRFVPSRALGTAMGGYYALTYPLTHSFAGTFAKEAFDLVTTGILLGSLSFSLGWSPFSGAGLLEPEAAFEDPCPS